MTNEQRAQMAIATARSTLGLGWAHVSVTVRRGLAMADLVGMVLGQDESISPERRLAILAGTAERIDANLGWSDASNRIKAAEQKQAKAARDAWVAKVGRESGSAFQALGLPQEPKLVAEAHRRTVATLDKAYRDRIPMTLAEAQREAVGSLMADRTAAIRRPGGV